MIWSVLTECLTGGTPVSSVLGSMLAHRVRLEGLCVGSLRYPSRPKDPFCHRDTFEPIIASPPPTLRTFAIDVLLAPSDGGARFPSIQRVELRILEGLWGWGRNKPILKEPVPSPLPRLKAAGLLQVDAVFRAYNARKGE